jgi:hypothetical protein
MSDHTVVRLELVGLFLAIWALSFGAVYLCCCQFVEDTLI